ncbi:MAG: thiol-disulfide isomerase [Flavobacterium sp. BFFFF2]|nr:MAG: thiol-disulfide isomerase [Flavobacterium sp. BFFFF2]
MKRGHLIIILFFVGFTNGSLFAQSTSFQQSLLLAKQHHQKVLLYFSGSDWCGPCQRFKNNFIESSAFKAYAEAHLMVVNADFPRLKKNQLSAEQTNLNEALAEQYNPNGNFPCILLLDETGKVLKRWEALPNMDVDTFIKALD